MPFRPGDPKPPTSGVKKGYKYPKTLEKDRVLAAMKAHIMSQVEEMVGAQLEHAKGVHYMSLRKSDGTYARATDVKQVDAAYAAGGETFDLFTQAPNTQAFAALMDRAFGKPSETHDVNISGSIDIRELLAKRHKPKV